MNHRNGHATNNAQEIALWIEDLKSTIARQEKAVSRLRRAVTTAKTPYVGKALSQLEQTLKVHKRTLHQFEIGAQMILRIDGQISPLRLPSISRPSSMIELDSFRLFPVF